MKTGKVSDTALRRSILKEVQKVNQGIDLPQVGGGAGSFPLYHVSGGLSRAGKETEAAEVYGSMQTVSGEGLSTAYLAAVRAANSLAAKAATPQYASVAITVPESMDERNLRKMHERYCEYLEQHNIKIVGGHTAVSAVVTEPMVSVQMTGVREIQPKPNDKCKAPEDYLGLDIVMTKHCGLGGTARLAGYFTGELTEKYPKRFIERAVAYLSETEKNEEA